MRLIAAAQFRDWTHFLRDPREVTGQGHRTKSLMLRFHIVDKVNMVGATQHHQLLLAGRPRVEFAYTRKRNHHVALARKIECGNVAAPMKPEFRGNDARL